MEKIAYIGIDVHKDTNSAFMFYRNEEGNPCFYEIMVRAVRKALKNCEIEDYDVLTGYEAGPTG